MVEALYNFSPTDKVTKVISPDTGWVKIITDGASKVNLERSSWGVCIRDTKGDVLQAQAKEIEELSCTNTQAEAWLFYGL